MYLLIATVHQLINGTSHHQHNSITVDISLSHYSIATRFNHVTVILKLTISTKMYKYYGCIKLYVHWNAISSPKVLHILLSFIGFVKKYSLMMAFLMQCVVQLRKQFVICMFTDCVILLVIVRYTSLKLVFCVCTLGESRANSQTLPTLQFSQYWPQKAWCLQVPCHLH